MKLEKYDKFIWRVNGTLLLLACLGAIVVCTIMAIKKTLPVVSKIDRSIGVQQAGDDEVLFFYSRAGKSYFKSLTVSSLNISEETEIGLN